MNDRSAKKALNNANMIAPGIINNKQKLPIFMQEVKGNLVIR